MKVNTREIKLLLSEKIIHYPVLIAILFLFNELRKNAIFYTLRENIFLVLIVLTFSLLINLICRKIIQNKSKAALIAAFSIFINLYYLDIVATIVSQKVLLGIIVKIMDEHRSIIIIPFLFFIWLIFIYLVMRIKRINPSVNLYLNTLIIIFIFVEIFKWVFIPVPNIQLDNNAPFPVNASIKLEQKPDIYYIILDSYTSSESLKKYWNFDN